MPQYNTVMPTVWHFHIQIIRLLLEMNTITISVLDGLFVWLSQLPHLEWRCRRHNYWHIYDVSCDGCKFMNCSLPQLSRKSRLYWRAPKSNIHRPEPNNFYSVLLNCRFTSHKSPVLSVYVPHTIATKRGKHDSSSFFVKKTFFLFFETLF